MRKMMRFPAILILLLLAIVLISGGALAFQASIVVPNGTGAQVRSGMNNALQAVTTQQSSTNAPNPTYPFMMWADTTSAPNNTALKLRNSQNTGWIPFGTINDGAGTITFPGSIQNAVNSTNLNNQPASYYQPASTAITTNNIGSQSVSYATSCGSASGAGTASNSSLLGGHAPSYFQVAGSPSTQVIPINATGNNSWSKTFTVSGTFMNLLQGSFSIQNASNDVIGWKVTVDGNVLYDGYASCNYVVGFSPIFMASLSPGSHTVNIQLYGGGTNYFNPSGTAAGYMSIISF